jgi:hypothetical protein
MTHRPISVVKVFSATKAQDREVLGDRISAWMEANPQLDVTRTCVSLSSDRKFHCLSFVLFCTERTAA